MPAEIAEGLSVDAAQVTRSDWPLHLWPIVFHSAHGALIIRRLGLCAAELISSLVGP